MSYDEFNDNDINILYVGNNGYVHYIILRKKLYHDSEIKTQQQLPVPQPHLPTQAQLRRQRQQDEQQQLLQQVQQQRQLLQQSQQSHQLQSNSNNPNNFGNLLGSIYDRNQIARPGYLSSQQKGGSVQDHKAKYLKYKDKYLKIKYNTQ